MILIKNMGLFLECFVEKCSHLKEIKMSFILSKVFVNIKTVLQNYCTQCLYFLSIFY